MYWKSIDYATSMGRENIFTDPLRLEGTGGEMVFRLPNGMHGYYISTGKGERLDSAPTAIVTDKFAEDKVVRNGLACMRCHDQGVKDFRDDVRPAVETLLGSAVSTNGRFCNSIRLSQNSMNCSPVTAVVFSPRWNRYSGHRKSKSHSRRSHNAFSIRPCSLQARRES